MTWIVDEYGRPRRVLDEKITKDMSAGEVVKDFVDSDNKMFSGDSKKQRIRRALGAYYAMKREK